MKRIVNVLIDRGDLAEAGGCWCRMSPGRIYATYHPKAPAGISACGVCDRLVLRGMGWWWQTPPDPWPCDADDLALIPRVPPPVVDVPLPDEDVTL